MLIVITVWELKIGVIQVIVVIIVVAKKLVDFRSTEIRSPKVETTIFHKI